MKKVANNFTLEGLFIQIHMEKLDSNKKGAVTKTALVTFSYTFLIM